MTWTDERIDEIERLRDEGHTAAQAAERLGVTKNTVIGFAARRWGGWGHQSGQTGRKAPHWTPGRVARLREQWVAGVTEDSIAAELGVTRGSVLHQVRLLKAAGVERKVPKKGSPVWQAMSEAERVAAIRERVENGMRQQLVAEEFEISSRYVSSICVRNGIQAPKRAPVQTWTTNLARQRAMPAQDVPDDVEPLTTMSAVRTGQCRAVLSDALDEDPAMCGRPVHTDTPSGDPSSYCTHHHRRFHRAELGPPPSLWPDIREGQPVKLRLVEEMA